MIRRPVQCDGIARGPEREMQIGVVGTVQPQIWGALASALAPVAIDLGRKALSKWF